MWKGTVVSIQIAPSEGAPMQVVTRAHAVPGRGLEGDRYYLGTGHFSPHFNESYEITLIELETIEALKRDYSYELPPHEARRNIVTHATPLNHLVQREFLVGEVLLRGIRLCEPCFHLAQLTHHNALSGLIHRGGLRAQILSDGLIYTGDTIRLLDS
jgi:MOSC domain-containing protein YiiM